MHWLLDDPVRRGVKVLWVTHREELLRQTAGTFVRSASLLGGSHERLAMRLIGSGFGSATTLPDVAHDVVVATIGSLARHPLAVRGFLAAHPCVVVFDEAHHAVARTWREILQLAREATDDAVVGLTATPTRMRPDERRMLGRLFEHTLAEVTLAELTAGGYLAEARIASVPTEVDAEALADDDDLMHLMQYGELSSRLASRLAGNVSRNRTIVDTYRRGPTDGRDFSYGQTIVFAVDVDHAHVLARDFAVAGVPAGALTASISTLYLPEPGNGASAEDVPRAELLERYRSGAFPVLVNVQVLTEGVDLPAVKTAFLARPTSSEVLMSQMVGRALRGEKVGGTPHAYLVSFRDHWHRFPDWIDPIRLSGLVDSPVVEEPAPTAAATPGVRIDLDTWRRVLMAAADEVRERLPATEGAPWTAVPIGLFAFEVELPIDDESGEDEELEARHVDLFVYDHDAVGFDELAAAVAAGEVGPDPELWHDRFFAETPEPRPALSRLYMLARYVAAEGEMPPFIALENRDAVDPRRIARRLFDADARRDEREATIAAAYDANPALVDAYYGGREGLRRQVLEQFSHLDVGEPESFDELRVPPTRGADRIDHMFATGTHDLQTILERVRTDPALFPEPLAAPAGGIEWTTRALGSIWADYQWQTDSPAHNFPKIRVNVLLDSPAVEASIIEFLVYHELLHHQDVLEGKTNPRTGAVHSPHDRDFRDREARHPALVHANAWIDTFHDRFAAIDDDGAPVAV
ncbi:DEAD/DEAH box helicase [Candidatus Solirubrobacter pratensis]|uniref:DEAD/DEAH box helicase n=1 Tax=Candidatus Solirubrobacter pratensis TaxID=1298857 RepID=UPI00041E39D9|nr:DEAD/DEAH box helicase family protein [Candidatus Solirubrobacter pratensis]